MSSQTSLQTNDFKKSRSAELVPPPVNIPTRSLPRDDADYPSWEDGGPTDPTPRLHYREYRPALPPNFSSVDFGILFDPDETSRVKIIIRGISCCESGWKKNITFWVIAKELLRQGDPHRLRLRLQLQSELALPQGTVLDWLQSKRLLDFVGGISFIDIRSVDLDLRMLQATLPHSVNNKQVIEPFLDPQGLLELTSFKFSGSLRCNIPQPWCSLDSISIVAKSLTMLCLDNLDDEGLNLLDCIVQEFSVNRLVDNPVYYPSTDSGGNKRRSPWIFYLP